VVKDAKYSSLRRESPPTFYAPLAQDTAQEMTVVVKFRGDSRASATPVVFQRIVGEVFAGARVLDVRTLDEVVNASVHQERVVAQLDGFFSVFALALACLGLYGLLSFAVVQRTREIGVRVALGAQRREVLSLVVGKGLKLALIGSALGLAGALAATGLTAVRCARRGQPAERVEAAALLALVTAFVLHGAVDYVLGFTGPYLLLAFSVGSVCALDASRRP